MRSVLLADDLPGPVLRPASQEGSAWEWFRDNSGPAENEVAWQYTEFAVGIVGVR